MSARGIFVGPDGRFRAKPSSSSRPMERDAVPKAPEPTAPAVAPRTLASASKRAARSKAGVAAVEKVSSVALESGLSARGYWVRKATLPGGEAEVKALKAELTMQPLQNGAMKAMMPAGGSPVTFPLYLESATKLYMPKAFAIKRYDLPPPERITLEAGAPFDAPLRFTGRLRDEQRKPVDAFLEAARDPRRMGGLLSMPCGFGKTVVALHLVAALGVRTMVVVHKDFLLDQWRERIAEFLPDARIGIVKAKVVDVRDRDIVIASLQSLSMKEYDADLFAGIGFVVIDECHRVGTEVFSRALRKINFRYSLGISATVQRKDGMTKAFQHYLGDVLFQGKRREDEVLVVQAPFWDADPAYGREVTLMGPGGKPSPNISRMINNLTQFAARTAVIVAAVHRMVRAEPGRKVLVLSDRKAQLADIKEGVERLCDPPVSAGFYWGGMKRPALAETEGKQVMCATFSYAAEGMDVPDLDTLILASPKSDIEQSCGRILRQKAETRLRTPLIFDIVDQFSLFERQGAKRRAFYRKHGYRIHRSLDALLAATCPTSASATSDDDAATDDDDALPSSSSFLFRDVEEA
jgi:hypothetical protein